MTMTRRLSGVTRMGSARLGARRAGLSGAQVRTALQPIIAVANGSVLAVEALARFTDQDDTEAVFSTAHTRGRGHELEALCLAAALERRTELPDSMLLSVNVSPNALPYVEERQVWPDDLRGVIVEITEFEVNQVVDLSAHLDLLRERGAAIAIDDVSTGYAGLLRLAQMTPDYVKIARQVVSGVADDPMRAAVLEALVTLSHRLGAAVIGEGVENPDDLAALGEFDVDYAQGFAIARPADEGVAVSADVVAACRENRRQVLAGAGSKTSGVARTRDVYAVTAALASADRRRDIDVAIKATASDINVDVIGVSILSGTLTLREIASTDELDPHVYALSDYPATQTVMNGREPLEIQLADPGADQAERELMQQLGYASMLLVPVRDGAKSIGVLEFAHRTPRRWTAHDIAHARGLAEHLAPALLRLGVGTGGFGTLVTMDSAARRSAGEIRRATAQAR
jgi:EAL domain-containing protein (putative c-di-GMP-specific phosphodiesterase class I)